MSDKSKQTYRHRLFKWVVMLTCIAVVLFPIPSMAEAGLITRGDVQSVLEAFGTGGRVVLFQASDTAGLHAAPADLLGSNGAIRPFLSWDGEHYCVDDWHVFVIGPFEGGDQSFTIQDAEEILSRWNFTFILTFYGESAVLDTVQTATKPLLFWEDLGFDNVYGFQEGRIVSPDEIAVGEYTLTVVAEFDGTVWFENSIQFFVDPSDSPTCTE